jgi:hypothetical protein
MGETDTKAQQQQTQRMSDAVALPFTHLTRKRVLANRCRIIIPHSVVACDAKKKKKAPGRRMDERIKRRWCAPPDFATS